MAGYLVDTNVVSELMKLEPNSAVLRWFERHDDGWNISSITVDELRYGVLAMPSGKRRDTYRAYVDRLVADYADDILPFDATAAERCAEFRWQAKSAGFNPGVQDMMIAAIADSRGKVLVTRNVKDFEFLDVAVENPFE